MRRVLLGGMVLGLAGCGLTAAQQKMIDEHSYLIGQERYIACNMPVGRTPTHPELEIEKVKLGEKIKFNSVIIGPNGWLYYGGVIDGGRQVYLWYHTYDGCTSENNVLLEKEQKEREIKSRPPIKIGMTRFQVEAMGWHGTLLRNYLTENGSREIWMFADSGYFLGYLTFLNDKLVLVEQRH